MTSVVFVAPYFLEATLRFLRATIGLPGVEIGLISRDPIELLPHRLRESLAAHCQVDDALDPDQLVTAVRHLSRTIGAPQRLFGPLEQLQVPLAEARARLGIPGMAVEAARNFRDKARMKTVLSRADLPCARHSLIESAEQALGFVKQTGFPIVVKPPAGAGAQATFRIDRASQLDQYLTTYPTDARQPILFEEFMTGDEHSFDSVCIEGRPIWYSISRYLPSPLEVMENPWIQWCVLLPRVIDTPEFADIRVMGFEALQTLGLQTGLTHMEWFRRPDGSLAISEVAARPPGAQITSLLSYAHDYDFYHGWARLMVFEEFPEVQRHYAVGAAYIRGIGAGQVKAVHGLDQAHRELRHLVAETQLPKLGQRQPSGYEGAGYVILRDPSTEIVEQALRRVVELIRVELA